MTSLPSLGPRGEGWVLIQVVLLAGVGLSGFAGPVVDDAPRFVLAVGGLVLIGVGGFLALRGMRDLRSALTPFPQPLDDAELVETGIYKRVRHPIYGGLVTAALGYGLLLASPLAAVGALGLLAFFRLKSSREEAWLRARYPRYEAYAARTRRMLPGLY